MGVRRAGVTVVGDGGANAGRGELPGVVNVRLSPIRARAQIGLPYTTISVHHFADRRIIETEMSEN